MHDVKWVLEHLDEATARLKKRSPDLSFDSLTTIAESRRRAVQRHNELRAEQNKLSREFGANQKTMAPEQASAMRERLKALSDEVKGLEAEAKELDDKLEAAALYIPNIPQAVVPEGKSDADNVVVKTWGQPIEHAFAALDHDALGEKLGILDFEAASRLAGNGFALYRGLGARLERALQSFFLDSHSEKHGYEEVLTPFMVRRECMVGTGQLPKFEDDAYRMDADDMFLIPTAEVSITNMYRGLMLEAGDLPKKLCGFSPCFRREAGSHGRDVRGLTRVHQFQKVELVHLSTPEDSARAHEELVGHAEAMLEALGLAYRRMELCGGDLGFGASRCYDLEVWLPVQKRWREISSCSNFLDFQARRADIRYRPEPGAKPRFVHTLNGSGLAIGRTVMAILEVYQTADEKITVPEVLRRYMGVDVIGPR